MVAIRSFGLTWVGGGAVAALGRLHEDKIRMINRDIDTIFFTADPHDSKYILLKYS
jgi:hypothetical protein